MTNAFRFAPAPRALRALLGGALLTVAGLAPLSAHALDIKLGHVLAPSHSWNKAAEGFAAEVKEKTAGRVNFVLFPSGQLGNEKTMPAPADHVVARPSRFVAAADRAEVRRGRTALHVDHLRAGLQGLRRRTGRRPVQAGRQEEPGHPVLVGERLPPRHQQPRPGRQAGRPRRPEDPRHARQDAPGLPFTALGAKSRLPAFGELYSALQQKVFDAQENPLSIIYTSSFFEVQKYLSLTGHVWGPANLIISKPIWNRLSAEDKQVVQAAADKWRDAQRKMISEGDQQFIAQLKEKGMQVNEVDKPAFAAAVEPVWKTYSVTYGPELMALVQKYREAK